MIIKTIQSPDLSNNVPTQYARVQKYNIYILYYHKKN